MYIVVQQTVMCRPNWYSRLCTDNHLDINRYQ